MVWRAFPQAIASFARRWRGGRPIPRHRLVVAVATGFAVLATVLVITWATDPPQSVVAGEIDGRTWLPVPRADGAALVLANGISGLVEAEAEVDAALPSGLQFADSDATYTLLHADDTSVVVADGSHVGTRVDTGAGSASVLAGGGLLTAGDAVTVRTIAADGSVGAPTTIDDAGVPTAGIAPVVDDDGDAWVLTGERADTAVRIDDAGRVAGRRQLDDGVTQLFLLDGRPVVRRGDVVEGIDDDARFPAPADGGIVPLVAQSANGRWAVASGRRVTV
ncbi:MAG: hypothetical protein ABW122_05120, partial [Ilumatobacteraceae bacterium]